MRAAAGADHAVNDDGIGKQEETAKKEEDAVGKQGALEGAQAEAVRKQGGLGGMWRGVRVLLQTAVMMVFEMLLGRIGGGSGSGGGGGGGGAHRKEE